MLIVQWRYLGHTPFIDFNCISLTGMLIFIKKSSKRDGSHNLGQTIVDSLIREENDIYSQCFGYFLSYLSRKRGVNKAMYRYFLKWLLKRMSDMSWRCTIPIFPLCFLHRSMPRWPVSSLLAFVCPSFFFLHLRVSMHLKMITDTVR